MPEGEKEEQEIENLLVKLMKENFPNLSKELDFQEVQEAQSPKEFAPKEAYTKEHHNYITQDYTEGENFTSSKRKGNSYLQRSSHKAVSWFLQRDLTGKKGMQRSIPRDERQGSTSKITVSSKAII